MGSDGYANPEALASLNWVFDHLNSPVTRIIEVGWGREDYDDRHILGALPWNFVDDLGATISQPDLASKEQIEGLLSKSGVDSGTTVVLYSGLSNLLATFAFWVLRLYGHTNIKLLDGGRQRWLEEDLPVTREVRPVGSTHYQAQPMNWRYRADRNMVLKSIGRKNVVLVDTRTPDMYRGETHPDIERGGHIPGAVNYPATMEMSADGSVTGFSTPSVNGNGTFRAREELQAAFQEKGITADKEIITYCVLGGLSTQAWFVLTELLGYRNVRVYERSWEEWGNHPELPIEC